VKKSWTHALIAASILTLLYSVVSSILFLKEPAIWPDEPYFVNIAENMRATGKPFLDLYGTQGVGSPHIRAYSYPPLYSYFLAAWISIFGSDITSIRGLSVVGGIAAVLLFYCILKKQTNIRLAFFGALALLLFGPFGMASRVGRMDIWVLFFTLAAYMAIVSRRYVYAGVFSSLALLLHPIGIISVVAPLVFIGVSPRSLVQKIRRIWLFTLPLCVSGLFWLATIIDHFDLFKDQILLQFQYKTQRTAIITLLFQNDPIWRIIILCHLVLGALSIIFGSYHKHIILKTHGIATFCVIILVILGVDQWYLPFLTIFPLFAATILINYIPHKNKLLGLVPAIVLLFLYSFQTISTISTQLRRNEAYIPFAQALENQIPYGATVALSVIPDPYFVLKHRRDLTLIQVPHVSTEKNLHELLKPADILIYNFATNEHLSPYIQTHLKHQTTVSQEDGYEALFIELKK